MTSPEDVAVSQDQQGTPASYYAILGLQPQASDEEIRQAYRRLSRLYHPDTTRLAPAIATAKFQLLNEAYGTLNNATRRVAYDRKLKLNQPVATRTYTVPSPTPARPTNKVPRVSEGRSAYLDPSERPLSPGEIFAVFILGLTFLGCLVLAIAIGITRGDMSLNPPQVSKTLAPPTEQVQVVEPAKLTPSTLLPAPAESTAAGEEPVNREEPIVAPETSMPEPTLEAPLSGSLDSDPIQSLLPQPSTAINAVLDAVIPD